MSTPEQRAAALRLMEQAADPKKLTKAQAAYRAVHSADLITAYRDVQRELEKAKP